MNARKDTGESDQAQEHAQASEGRQDGFGEGDTDTINVGRDEATNYKMGGAIGLAILVAFGFFWLIPDVAIGFAEGQTGMTAGEVPAHRVDEWTRSYVTGIAIFGAGYAALSSLAAWAWGRHLG